MRMRTQDSTLAYFVNQLTAYDPKFHEPLFSTTWQRDINLRPDVTFANESTSFVRTKFASSGSQNATGKPWISANTKALEGIQVNGEYNTLPVRLLGTEVSYSSIELERSQLLGQPIDMVKLNALNNQYQLFTDEMVYVGDSQLGIKGLINSTLVTASSVVAGASTSTLWSTKTPDEILFDVNDMVQTSWANTGWAKCPTDLRLPPAQFAYISSQKVSTAGNVSILTFLEENSISLRVNGTKLNIQPVKWLTGSSYGGSSQGGGAAGANRMMCYTNSVDLLRFPMVPMRRETAYYQGINFTSPYVWAYGEMEFIYPETLLYRDGI